MKLAQSCKNVGHMSVDVFTLCFVDVYFCVKFGRLSWLCQNVIMCGVRSTKSHPTSRSFTLLAQYLTFWTDFIYCIFKNETNPKL